LNNLGSHYRPNSSTTSEVESNGIHNIGSIYSLASMPWIAHIIVLDLADSNAKGIEDE